MLAAALATILMLTAPTDVDDLERRLGVTNVAAAVANGRLALGLSAHGEVTALRWPSPGLFDQLHYVTLGTAPDGTSARTLPRGGASANMGLFIGLVFEQGGNVSVEWLRDPSWQSTLGYVSSTSTAVRSEHRSAPRTLNVVQEVWLHPNDPVIALRIEFRSAAGSSGILPRGVLLFENLAPCDRRLLADPGACYRDDPAESDNQNDFGLIYSERADALVHFRPVDRSWWLAELAPSVAHIGNDPAGHLAADAIVDRLALEEVEGSFFVLGAEWGSSGHQVGRVDAADLARPQDAYFDAADGALRGQPAVLGSANGALHIAVTSEGDGVTFYLAAGRFLGSALDRLERARLAGFASLVEEVERSDTARDRSLAAPATDDPGLQAVAKRAIHSLPGAQSAESGAHSASVAAQPPLALDCPAMSAFVDEALGVAALYDAVEHHQRFLQRAARADSDARPHGAFARCYYSDGGVASEIGFSIDATGLALWSLARHTTRLWNEGQRDRARAALTSSRETIIAAAETLLACRDPATGLTCPASEGDSPELVQGLLGAATTIAGLRATAQALETVAEDPDRAQIYSDRASELNDAVLERLTDGRGLLVGSPTARALAFYPARILTGEEEIAAVEIDRLLNEIEADVARRTDGVVDLALRLWSLTYAIGKSDQARERLDALVIDLFSLADPETSQYGAVMVPVDDDGEGHADRLEHRVGTPFLPSGALAYLTAVAYFGRRPPAAAMGPIDNCFCAAAHHGDGARPSRGAVMAVTTVAGFLLARRRRPGATR